MPLTSHITSVEIHDDTELVASITMMDSVCCTVEIKGAHNAASWPELAEAVRQALASMNLEGDKP